MAFFTWGDGGVQMTPERIAAERKVAQAMMERGMDFSPVQHWTQGAARVAQSLAAAQDYRGLHEAEGANEKLNEDLTAKMLAAAGGGRAPSVVTPSAVAPPVAVPPAAPTVLGAGGQPAVADAEGVYGPDATMMPGAPTATPDYGKAIASIESGGRYDALGPATRTGDRAYGKYQVMGANIPAWTKTHLGQEMTPEQFLANPQAQDAVFKGQFGQYVQQHGNPQDAASMWFSGKPLAGNNRSDVLGTTVPSYVQKFTKNLGRQGPVAAPTAVAAAPVEDPAALPPNAAPAQGFAIPGQPAPAVAPVAAPSGLAAVNPSIIKALQSPYTSEATKKIAGIILQHQMQGDQVTHVDLGGQVGIMDKRGNIIRTVQKTEPTKAPTIVDGPVDPATGYPTKLLLRGDGTHTPINAPSAAPGAIGTIPPPPPGARGKEWVEGHSKRTVEAALSLPDTISKAQQSLDLITALEKHGGRETATGLSSVIDPRNYIPGTNAKDFQIKQRQLQGKAFLEAFESLKGGGAITEIEGKKATEAIAALDTSQSDKAYLQSIRELRVIIKNGIEKAKQKADPTYRPQLEAMPTDEKPTGKTKSGVTWSVE